MYSLSRCATASRERTLSGAPAPDSPFCRCTTSSPGAGEVFPLRESQAVKLITKALGIMRRFPAVLLPLPLGEVDLRSKDGEGARRQPYFKVSNATRNLASTSKSSPFGGAGTPSGVAERVQPSPWGRWLDAKRQDGRGTSFQNKNRRAAYHGRAAGDGMLFSGCYWAVQ